MSSRYSICASADQLQERFSVEVNPGFQPSYNACPGQLLPVITNTGPQGVSFFYWGLAPLWAKGKPISEKIFNIRAELIAEKSSLRKTMAQHRCIVPADGIYEWKKIGKKTTIPYRYQLPEKRLFSFAALWDEYEDGGEDFHTFSIITVPGDAVPNAISERVPVILNPDTEKIWLSASDDDATWLAILNHDRFADLDHYTISPRINSLTANDAGLLTPAPPADQFGNLTLFS